MSTGLIRLQDKGHLHFLTISCFRHRPILGTPEARDTFVRILKQTSQSYKFESLGYVVMPDYVHLLLSEPEAKPLSIAVQVLKQRFSRTRPEPEVWESRYYDFNVYTAPKFNEKLAYIHLNPVRRDLVLHPAQWLWSSFRHLQPEAQERALTTADPSTPAHTAKAPEAKSGTPRDSTRKGLWATSPAVSYTSHKEGRDRCLSPHKQTLREDDDGNGT